MSTYSRESILAMPYLREVTETLGIFHRIAYAWRNMPETRTDEDLMLAYKKGEVHAFEILYRRYRKPLYRYL